jgi:hypothetical protein
MKRHEIVGGPTKESAVERNRDELDFVVRNRQTSISLGLILIQRETGDFPRFRERMAAVVAAVAVAAAGRKTRSERLVVERLDTPRCAGLDSTAACLPGAIARRRRILLLRRYRWNSSRIDGSSRTDAYLDDVWKGDSARDRTIFVKSVYDDDAKSLASVR